MKVQILIPCYNGSKTIQRCLESALKQTYKDIEIIFLDDCSTDNTAEIAKKYNIRYYKNDINLGRGGSRNKLLDLATSEYCCWLDADDYMLPDKIKKQINYITYNNKCNFLATEMYDMTSNMIVGAGGNKAHMMNSLTLETLRKSNCINHPTVMFRLETAKKIRFKDNMKFNEDWDFYIRAYENGFKVVAIPEKLYVYNL